MPRKRKAEARAGPEPESASAQPEIKEDAGTKKVRTHKRRTLTPDEAQTLIGEVFVATSCWSAVKAYRVVGLTRTSKSALLERVPVLTVGQDRYADGSRKIDRAFLDQHPVREEPAGGEQGKLLRDKLPDLETKLILVSKPSEYSKTPFERAHFNFGECAYWAKDLDRVYSFVEY